MTDQRTPTTKAGRADHDLAWGPAPGNEWTMNHQNDREGCGGCERIAAIEAEAAALDVERASGDAALWGVFIEAWDRATLHDHMALDGAIDAVRARLAAEEAAG